MNAQHTPGRLTVRGGYSIYADDGKTPVADTCLSNSIPANDEANARRLVACWNACEGLTTEHLENIDMLGETLAGRFAAFHASERELMDTRDELLAALKDVLAAVRYSSGLPETVMQFEEKLDRIKAASKRANAAITKAEGGAA